MGKKSRGGFLLERLLERWMERRKRGATGRKRRSESFLH